MEGDEDQGRQGMPAEAGRAGGVGERDRDRGCGRPGGCNSPLECRGHRILRAFRRRGLGMGFCDRSFRAQTLSRVRDIAGLSGSFLFPVTQSEDRKFLRSFGLPVAASARFWLGLLL